MLRSIALSLICLAIIISCRGMYLSDHELSATLTGDVDEAFERHLPVMCELAYMQLSEARAEGMESAQATCSTNLIKLVCVLNKDSLTDAADMISQPDQIVGEFAKRRKQGIEETTSYLMEDPSIAPLLANDHDRLEIRDIIVSQFREEVSQCLGSAKAAYDESVMSLSKEIFADDEAANLRDHFWSYALKAMFVDQVPSAAVAVAQGAIYVRLALKVKGIIGYGMCQGSAALVASMMEANTIAAHESDDACREVKDHVRSKWFRSQACWRLASDVCGAAIGSIDFRRWGIEPNDETLRDLVSLASTGAWAACHYGSKAGLASAVATGGTSLSVPIACGVGNVAISTIVEQVRTGNNAFAQCAGTDKLGACIGQNWASGGWTNNKGVEMPYLTPGRDGQKWLVRRCCQCSRRYYERGMVVNSIVRDHTYMSVIQKGDFHSGNCRSLEGPYHEANQLVYRYEQCRDTFVVGSSCQGIQAEDNTFFVRSWDVRNQSPGPVIVHRN